MNFLEKFGLKFTLVRELPTPNPLRKGGGFTRFKFYLISRQIQPPQKPQIQAQKAQKFSPKKAKFN